MRDRHAAWRGLRWTLAVSGGFPAGRNVRSVRRSRVVLAPRPWRQAAGKAHAATVARKAAHRGEHEVNRKAIARGKPGCLGCTCQSRVRFLLPLHMAMRAQSAPGFPCALFQEEGHRIAEPGRNRVAGMRRRAVMLALSAVERIGKTSGGQARGSLCALLQRGIGAVNALAAELLDDPDANGIPRIVGLGTGR